MNVKDLLMDELDEVEGKAPRQRSVSTFRKAPSQRKTYSRKRGKAPVQFNGIHRRRSKGIRW